MALLASSTFASDGPRIAEIIENVQANESLYENLDVSITASYRKGKAKYDEMFPGTDFTDRGNWRLRYVGQGLRRYLDSRRDILSVSGKNTTDSRLFGFDGAHARILKDGIGNIRDDCPQSTDYFLPHTSLMAEQAGLTFPLSAYLKGTAYLHQIPSGIYKSNTIDTRIEKQETIAGHLCDKIRIEDRRRGERSLKGGAVRFIWLAQPKLSADSIGILARGDV